MTNGNLNDLKISNIYTCCQVRLLRSIDLHKYAFHEFLAYVDAATFDSHQRFTILATLPNTFDIISILASI